MQYLNDDSFFFPPQNNEKHEKIDKHLSPSENKRSHSDSTDADNEKRKKKYKNTKKKVVKQ